MKKLLLAIIILSFLALPITGYLIYLHYVPEASEFCNFSTQFNCEIVNKSQWSYVDLGFVEIPVALMGFVTYVIFFIVGLGMLKNFDYKKICKCLGKKTVYWLMFALSVVGLIFSGYLTYIEAFVLFTFCLFCVFSQIIILALTVLWGVAAKKAN